MIALAMTLLMTAGEFDLSVGLGLRLLCGHHVDALQRGLRLARDRLLSRARPGGAHRPDERPDGDEVADPFVPRDPWHAPGRSAVPRSTSPAASRNGPGRAESPLTAILVGDFYVPTPWGDLRLFMSIFWFALFALILGYILMASKFGNWIQAAGGNPAAATARGVRVGAHEGLALHPDRRDGRLLGHHQLDPRLDRQSQ